MILSPAPWLRIILFFLTVATAVGLYSEYGNLQESGEPLDTLVIPAVIGVICLAGTLYEESWVFDRKERMIKHYYGLKIVPKKIVFSFDDIEALVHVIFLREDSEKSTKAAKPISGETAKKLLKLSSSKHHQELHLNVRNETYVKIEAIDSRRTDILNEKARKLASFTGIPLID